MGLARGPGQLADIATGGVVRPREVFERAPSGEVVLVKLFLLSFVLLSFLVLARHLLVELRLDELVFLEFLLACLARGHLVNARVALIALNIWHFFLLLLQLARELLLKQDLRLHLVLGRLVVRGPAVVLLSPPRVDVRIDAALVLRDVLVLDNLLLHALNEALECVELSPRLHLAEASLRVLLIFQLRERAVHRALDVLLDERGLL